jgi:hypothetical protein
MSKVLFLLAVTVVLVSLPATVVRADEDCFVGRLDFIGPSSLLFKVTNGTVNIGLISSNMPSFRGKLEKAIVENILIRVCINDYKIISVENIKK